MRPVNKYPINQSPLYKITTKRKLAQILNVELHDLLDLASRNDNYEVFTANTQPIIRHPLFIKKQREVQKLKSELANIHTRILALLSRIEVPQYLHSAVKGKSYTTNAAMHKDSRETLKIDIKSFYPNIKYTRIYYFFNTILLCSCDVSYILMKICCYNNHLPTGSCLSPLLSFFTNFEMYERLHRFSESQGLKFTVYVDDIVFSGNKVTESISRHINHIIRDHCYTPHKQKKFKENAYRIVTGLVLYQGRIDIPHRRKAKIRVLLKAIEIEKSETVKQKLCLSLRGMVCECRQYSPKLATFIDSFLKRHCSLCSSRKTGKGLARTI